MFLDYFALGVLLVVVLVCFYGVIVIHDIPYEIAVKRNHPHQDAIHAAGWVSVYPACHLALSLDLGHDLSTGTRLGLLAKTTSTRSFPFCRAGVESRAI